MRVPTSCMVRVCVVRSPECMTRFSRLARFVGFVHANLILLAHGVCWSSQVPAQGRPTSRQSGGRSSCEIEGTSEAHGRHIPSRCHRCGEWRACSHERPQVLVSLPIVPKADSGLHEVRFSLLLALVEPVFAGMVGDTDACAIAFSVLFVGMHNVQLVMQGLWFLVFGRDNTNSRTTASALRFGAGTTPWLCSPAAATLLNAAVAKLAVPSRGSGRSRRLLSPADPNMISGQKW